MLCETGELLEVFLNLLVSVVSLMLAGKEFQAAGPHDWSNIHQLRTSAAFDVVGSVGGPDRVYGWIHKPRNLEA